MNEGFSAKIAEAYGRHSQKYAAILEPILRPVADEMVRLGRLAGGEQVLDLATGTGLIARTAAQSGASITGVDVSWGVLAKARTLSAGAIPFVAGDAHRLPFANHCVDLVTCSLSLSHFSDVLVALEEVRRVLRPKGRFITSAWGNESHSPAKEVAVEVRKRFLEDRELTFAGAFGEEVWADPERGRETLRLARFANIQVTTLLLSGEHRNSSEAVEAALAWPITRYRIARLDPEDQQRLREETTAAIREVDDLRWQSEVHTYQAVSRPEGPFP